MALIPVNHMNYQTIALETDRTLYIKKTPLEIIQRGCLDNFSSFAGRRESIQHLTGFSRKTPIPISIYRNIIAFPTHAFKNWDCCWIFYNHVDSIVEKLPNQSVILFKNGNQVTVEVPKLELLKQLERTNFILSIIKRTS